MEICKEKWQGKALFEGNFFFYPKNEEKIIIILVDELNMRCYCGFLFFI